MSQRSSNWLLAGLTVSTSAIATILFERGLTTWLESLAFVSGALCVWLTVRERIWNFPIGMVNVAAFAIVFFQVRLFADAGLQIVYFVLGGIGWYMWLFGGAGRTPLPITRTPYREIICVTFIAITICAGEYFLLVYVGGSSPFWDALTTSVSLAAQWLLNRKRLENWLLWIMVDIIYIPLYLSKQLYLTALLYAIFLCMASIGLYQWRLAWRRKLGGEE